MNSGPWWSRCLGQFRRADNRGRPWHDTRAVLNGVLWVLGTGPQWREMPEKYPPYQTCHRRSQQWVRTGKLEEALKELARHPHERGQPNPEEAFVDATFASAKKGGFAVGATRRGKGTKIIAIAADNSLPLDVSVDSASSAECRLVEYVLAGSFLDHLPTRLIGAKAYDSDPLDRRLHEESGKQLQPPERKPSRNGPFLKLYVTRRVLRSGSGGWSATRKLREDRCLPHICQPDQLQFL
jgi:transposase